MSESLAVIEIGNVNHSSSGSRYQRVNLWLSRHWVVAAFVQAASIAIGFIAVTAAYGGPHLFATTLGGFVAALAVGLPLGRRKARLRGYLQRP